MTKMLLIDAAALRGWLAKAQGDVKIAHQAGYAFYGGRWHKVTQDKPAPKGAPVAAHPEAAGSHGPLKHFTDAQWEQLKLPDSNVNAPSFNKALAKLREWSEAGNVTAIVGAGYGSNTYGQKLAAIANHLLGLHGSKHQVSSGQKAGTHAGVQASPAPAASPEQPLPDLDSPEDMAADHTKPAAAPAGTGPLQMPDFEEGKTTTGVKAYYEKAAQKVIDHGHAGNAAVLEDMLESGKKPNAKGKVPNTWAGETANSKKLLALHAQALAHAKGGAAASAAAPAPADDGPVAGWKAAIAAGKQPTKAQAEHMAALEDSDPDAYMDAFMEAVNNSIPADQHTDEAFDDALDVAHSKAHKLHQAALDGGYGVGWDKASDGSDVYANHPAKDDGPKDGDTKPGANGQQLVFKNGRWHKYVDADESGELPPVLVQASDAEQGATPVDGPLTAEQLGMLQSIPWHTLKLPDSNTNAASVNKKLQAIQDAAFAGNVAALHAMKFGTNTYGKKLALAAQTAIAALQGGGAPAAAQAAPEPAKPAFKILSVMKGSLPNEGSLFKINQGNFSAMAKALGLPSDAFSESNSETYTVTDYEGRTFSVYMHGGGLSVRTSGANKDMDSAAQLVDFLKAADAAASDKVTELSRKQIAGLKGWLAAGQPTSKHPDSWSNLWKKLSPGMKKAVKEEAAAPTAAPPVTATTPLTADQQGAIDKLTPDELSVIDGTPSLPANVQAAITAKLAAAAAPAKIAATTLHNTSDGHNKEWSVSVVGKKVMVQWGAIGAKQQQKVYVFPEPSTAYAFASKQTSAKLKGGYVGTSKIAMHEWPADAGAAADPGPKDGDTKQGADGMLVFKNGRWHKVEQAKAVKALTQQAIDSIVAAVTPGQPKLSTNFPAKMATKAAKAGDAAGMLEAYQQAQSMQYPKTASHIKGMAGAMGIDTSAWDASAPAAAPAAPAAPMSTPIPSMDDWQQTGGQGGSNPGGKFKDPATGTEYYCKFPADEATARSEVLAAKLYGLAGLAAQDAMLVRHKGKLGIASKWVEVKKAGSPAALAATKEAQAGFAVDAWLANWDVVGLGYDNLQVGPDGKAIRIDAGGSLEYRAQGAKKPFGPKVGEIDTLRDAKLNPQAAAVFGKMTEADITASVAKVAAIEDSAIRALVFDHGPGTEAEKKALADTLIARKADLLARYPKAAKAGKKPLDPSKLPIDPKTVPKPHDFENWNGPGKGLSSKDAINKSNAAVEYQMMALAQAGNLTALRTFEFDEVDKDTGKVTGKKTPVTKHPSKHVQQYHQDLLQLLDEVANPPEPLKVFADTDVSSLAALNAAFPPKKFGTTVAKVASNEKLGFWVALGSVGGAEKFRPKSVSNYTSAAIAAAKAKYHSASKLAKHFISSVQASGSYNDLFRDGKTKDHAGNDLKEVAKAALAHATEMPEGTSLYRWQKMSPQMISHIMAAKEGTVFQATGPMCTSYDPTATKHFGTHRVVVRYAKGAKAVESFASGGFAGEKEVTTLPNSRFVVLSKKMVPDVEHGNPSSTRLELEILMLPPDLGI